MNVVRFDNNWHFRSGKFHVKILAVQLFLSKAGQPGPRCTPCRAWTARRHRLFWWVWPSLLRHASRSPSPGQPQDGNGLSQVFTHNPSNRPAVELCWEQIHCFLSINNSPKCPPLPVIIIVNPNHSPSWCGRMPAPLVTLPKYLHSVGLAPAPNPLFPAFSTAITVHFLLHSASSVSHVLLILYSLQLHCCGYKFQQTRDLYWPVDPRCLQ